MDNLRFRIVFNVGKKKKPPQLERTVLKSIKLLILVLFSGCFFVFENIALQSLQIFYTFVSRLEIHKQIKIFAYYARLYSFLYFTKWFLAQVGHADRKKH
jgi:hypothetical protein